MIMRSARKTGLPLIAISMLLTGPANAGDFLRIDYYVWARHADSGIKTRAIQNLDILIYFDFGRFLPDENGRLSLGPDAEAHLKKLKAVMHPDTELWLGVSSLNNLIGKPRKIANFVSSVKKLAFIHGFKGLDIDWEGDWNHLSTADYIDVVSAVSGRLRTRTFRISTSHASGSHYVEKAAGIKDLVDWINVQLYWSAHNSWSVAAVESRLRAFHDRGIPPGKLSIGLPVYGAQDMAAYTPGAKTIGYAQMLSEGASPETNLWTRPSTGIQYHYSGVPLIRAKAEHAIKHGYRGLFSWELTIDADYTSEASIARAIDKAIRNSIPKKQRSGRHLKRIMR